ncbi:hotdog fold thioesterase [Arthrobacter mobilis]|uniref:hotdog fold thioesterase n=1 Tax=Arthrobacter mobilis TaxID=2724944 RepID=UPI00197BC839|nr:hotdog fold thioesterase [Arthrobacter mobilis]
MTTSPATENFGSVEELIRHRYSFDKSSQHLGIEVVEAEEGRVVMAMDVQESMLNGHHILHGGYLFTLGDTCFAFVCESMGAPSVSRQAEITYIAPGGAGARLVATGIERTRFGRNNIVDISIHDQDGQHLAEMRVFGVLVPKK